MSEEIPQCPLVTEYTTRIGIKPSVLENLFILRSYDYETEGPVPFTWPRLLRTHLPSGEPLRLREYQKQMIHHLLLMPKFICGDAVGLGKTLEAIAAAAYLKSKFSNAKFIVLTTKSTTYQWKDEFERFSLLRPYVMRDSYNGKTSYEARFDQLEKFLSGEKKDVIICKYTSMIGKRRKIDGKFDEDGNPIRDKREIVSQEIRQFQKIFAAHQNNIVLILDECQKFKSPGTATRQLVRWLSKHAGKIWSLSATVIKNGLEEFYSIAEAMRIEPLGDLWEFGENYCKWGDQYIGQGRHKRVITGYQNVPEFKRQLRPFFFGRSQRQVKEPLPILSTIFHPLDLDETQAKLLLEDIPNGTFKLPPILVKDADAGVQLKERKPDNMMTMLSVQQLVANHWALLDRLNEKAFHTKTLSPKEEALLDLLDGDYRGEKVIVFSKYRSWIDRLEWLTVNKNFTERNFLRVTGNENETERAVNMQKFQDPNSGYDLIVINSAALEGVNLQQAAHMICLDLPWSWGDLIQLVGRMVRMASPHSSCTLHVLVSKGTIDEYTVDTLKSKKGVFEKILGESHSAGILDDKSVFDLSSGMEAGGSDEEFRTLMQAFVRKTSMKTFLKGEQIELARDNEDYTMVFEKGKKKSPSRRKGPSDEELDAKWKI